MTKKRRFFEELLTLFLVVEIPICSLSFSTDPWRFESRDNRDS